MSQIQRTGQSVGATLFAGDLAELAASPDALGELRNLLDERAVLHIASGQPLSAETYSAIAYSLGLTREKRPASPVLMPGYEHIAVFAAASKPDDGREPVRAFTHSLHYDYAGSRLASYSMLHTRDIPQARAQEFVDMAALLENLPKDLRALVAHRNALHGRLPGPNAPMEMAPPFDAEAASKRPLVVRHWRTGRPLLFLPRHPMSLIEGLPDDEGRAILADLWRRADETADRFACTMRSGDMVIWDNLAATHTNPPYRRDADRTIWFSAIPSTARLEPYAAQSSLS